jgi:hypothetical protein
LQIFKLAESEHHECAVHAVRALANVAFCPPGHDAIISEPDSLEVVDFMILVSPACLLNAVMPHSRRRIFALSIP